MAIRTYDQAIKHIEAGIEDCLGDNPEFDRDTIYADIAESILYDATESVGREICRTQMGFTPQGLERMWAADRAARAAASKKREAARSAAQRAKTAAAAEAAVKQQINAVRTSRCPKCFTVPAANGSCNC